MGTLIYIWDAPRAELATWPMAILLYKMLYNTHGSPRGPCVAIQLCSAIQRYAALYSAIHYTVIHRYTLYRLYNTPLQCTQTDRYTVGRHADVPLVCAPLGRQSGYTKDIPTPPVQGGKCNVTEASYEYMFIAM